MQKVDLEYQHIANITPIKNIVLCKNKESARHFLDYVYDHFIDCIVASADCEYPKNSALKDKVFFGIFHEQGLGKTKIAIDLALYWLENNECD